MTKTKKNSWPKNMAKLSESYQIKVNRKRKCVYLIVLAKCKPTRETLFLEHFEVETNHVEIELHCQHFICIFMTKKKLIRDLNVGQWRFLILNALNKKCQNERNVNTR